MTYINQAPKEFAAQSAKFRKLREPRFKGFRFDTKEEGLK